MILSVGLAFLLAMICSLSRLRPATHTHNSISTCTQTHAHRQAESETDTNNVHTHTHTDRESRVRILDGAALGEVALKLLARDVSLLAADHVLAVQQHLEHRPPHTQHARHLAAPLVVGHQPPTCGPPPRRPDCKKMAAMSRGPHGASRVHGPVFVAVGVGG
jgi:hypothetical protein